MQNRIISYLADVNSAKTINELCIKLNENKDEIENSLNDLVKKGIIHKTKKHKYIHMKYCNSLKVGKITIAKNGYAFLIQDNGDEDIFIAKDNINGAIENDFVLVDTFIRHGKNEGKVIEVLDRNLKNVIGTIKTNNDEMEFILDDKKLNIKVIINKNYFKSLVDGHKVLIELTDQIEDKVFNGTIIKIIGHINDPDIDIVSIAYKYNIAIDFSEEAMKELAKIPEEVKDNDKVGRVDLTREMIFTIDGDDTKDIDDAISLKKKNNIYELGVHIADVSYYVKPNTNLYNEAYERGTSNYLANRVIPMLPHELSNGICSLNPNVERLAISVVMQIDDNGKVISYDIFPSVIKSRKQMTYKNVNKIIMDGEIPEGYEEYKDTLIEMNDLAQILRKKMVKDGYIEFDIPEAKIIQDENGKCIDVVKRVQLDAEKLIEDFMIIANVTVATHIYNMDLPFVYRVHGKPKNEKIDEFLNMLKELKINVNTKNIDASSKSMQELLDSLKDLKEAPILSSMLLRSMQKAIYSTNNIGHFGLSLKNYCHFTSPIRRFPDTTVHQLLRIYLFNKEIDNSTIDYYSKYLVDVSEHSSEKEQNAVAAEREVVDMKMAEYMESHIGEEFEGMITTVANFGFFVQLPNLIEGLVHISTLSGNFIYMPEILSLVSKEKKYRIGDIIKVKVIAADKNLPGIDFEVI